MCVREAGPAGSIAGRCTAWGELPVERFPGVGVQKGQAVLLRVSITQEHGSRGGAEYPVMKFGSDGFGMRKVTSWRGRFWGVCVIALGGIAARNGEAIPTAATCSLKWAHSAQKGHRDFFGSATCR